MTVVLPRRVPARLEGEPRLSLWRRYWSWATQGHVTIGLVLLAKLVWFDSHIESRFTSPARWLATVGTVVLLVCWLPLVRPRLRLGLILILDVSVSTLLIADLLYYRYFDNFVTVAILTQASQMGEVWASILALMHRSDAIFIIDIPLGLLFVVIRGGNAFLRPVLPFRTRRTKELVIFSVIIGVTFVATPIEAQRRMGDALDGWWDVAAYQATGAVAFHGYDLVRFASQNWFDEPVTREELDLVRSFVAGDHETPSQRRGAPTFGEFAGANVLVVQVEALESRAIGRSFANQPLTPHLDRLVRRSVQFSNFFHQVSVGHTSDAELMAGCSLYPAKMGTAFFKYAGNDLECLPSILARAGYSSRAHHAYEKGFWNRYQMYPAMGYDKFEDLGYYHLDEPLGWSLGDRSFLRQTVEHLASRERPFYDVAITLSTHHPFDVSSPGLDLGNLEGTMMGDYLESVHYADSAIGALVDELKESGLWESTVLVVYGDHDSGIHDPNQVSKLLGHDPSAYEFARGKQTVPLIMHFPGSAHAGEEVATPSGQIDIPPTLLHALGIEPTRNLLFGANRFSSDKQPVIFRNGGYVDDQRMWLPAEPGTGCFDVATQRAVASVECATVARKVGLALRVSDLVLDHDLVSVVTE